MPRTMWISALAGLATGVALSLAFAIWAAPTLAGMLLIFAAGSVFLGFMGLLYGLGVGAILYAPKWAIPGALLACIPFAYMFATASPPAAPNQEEGPWYVGILIFAVPASCGAVVGALLQVRRRLARSKEG